MFTIKHKLFVDYEKEEKWLNEMCQKGLALRHYTFLKYHFENCEPGQYIYRLQLLEHDPTHAESKEYLDFVQDLDVEVVDTYIRWVYFRKLASEGPFEIHSDIASKIKHHKAIMSFTGIIALSNFTIALSNLSIGMITKFNLYFVGINGFFAVLLGYLSYKQYRHIQKLKAEQIIIDS